MPVWSSPLPFLAVLWAAAASAADLGLRLGDHPASELARAALTHLLRHPRPVDAHLETLENPLLPPLAVGRLQASLTYSNISLVFHQETISFLASRIRIRSHTNLTANAWPVTFGEEIFHTDLEISEVNVRIRTVEEHMELENCELLASALSLTTENYWILNKLSTLAAPFVQKRLSNFVCPSIEESLLEMNRSLAQELMIREIVPEKLISLLAVANASIHYRIRSMTVLEREIVVQLQIEWNDDALEQVDDRRHLEAVMEMEGGGDEMRIWLEESAINELLGQVEWHQLALEELIPVTSPAIPDSQRNFLFTLCTTCYFILNLTGVSPPTIAATNASLVLHTEQSVNLRVVNPERNVSTVFMAFVIQVTAQLRPTVDNGTIRTMVQLLDTNIKLEKGVFPPTWSLFVQDLMKGMILDMIWPELRTTIEQFSYKQGIRLADTCGFDGLQSAFLIDEGRVGIRTRLALDRLDPSKCIADMRASIPNTAALLQSGPNSF